MALEQHLLLNRCEEREVVSGLIETLEKAEVEHVSIHRLQVALGKLGVVVEAVQGLDHNSNGSEEAVNELVERPALKVAVGFRVAWKLEQGGDHELVHTLRTVVGMLSL